MLRSGLAFMLLVAVALAAAGCDREKAKPVQEDARPEHLTVPPPIWAFARMGTDRCVWQKIAFDAQPTQEIAEFPMRCDDADLGWSGDRAIVWLSISLSGDEALGSAYDGVPRSRLFVLTLGGAPAEVPAPVPDTVHAVGFDDVPLVYTTPSPSSDDDIRTWALVDGKWVERDHSIGKKLRDTPTWKTQRGQAARKVRELGGLVAMPAEEVAQLGDVRSQERAALDVSRAIEQQLRTADAGATGAAGGGTVHVTPSPTSWWRFHAGGIAMAIRGREDRLLPDLRRLDAGRWEKQFLAMNTDSIRLEIWPAGVEVRGTWLLVTSDGRAGVLVDAHNNRKKWGLNQSALSLFAP